ncbi:MAG: hypothetical protein HKL87_02240 [Acidimicrobiaceae bacterium]|nr:hypothetical protein [Acidimicrobiaceae bacterium]
MESFFDPAAAVATLRSVEVLLPEVGALGGVVTLKANTRRLIDKVRPESVTPVHGVSHHFS